MTNNSRERGIYRVTIVGSIVNIVLVIFKFLAGILGHSAAMIADAVHSLSDFVTDIVVLLFIRISGKPADEDHGYGHGKYETLATVVISLILFGVGVGIIVNAVEQIVAFMNGVVPQSPSTIALVAAALSIVVKELLYRYTVRAAEHLNSQTVVANAWHHRSDALSSVGVLIGIGGAMFLGEQWRVLDPLAALVVSGFIIKVSINLFKPCIEELLERSLPEDVERQIESIILSVDGVTSPHHLRTRRIGNNYAIEVHIRMDGNLTLNEAHRITTTVERQLKAQFGAGTHVGIHTEPIK
ncbi:MAG: cation transporter [Alistipes sp.]|nr:cation transporter [Alistipes sp.]